MIINSININKQTITSHLNWTHWTQKNHDMRHWKSRFLAWDRHKNV